MLSCRVTYNRQHTCFSAADWNKIGFSFTFLDPRSSWLGFDTLRHHHVTQTNYSTARRPWFRIHFCCALFSPVAEACELIEKKNNLIVTLDSHLVMKWKRCGSLHYLGSVIDAQERSDVGVTVMIDKAKGGLSSACAYLGMKGLFPKRQYDGCCSDTCKGSPTLWSWGVE